MSLEGSKSDARKQLEAYKDGQTLPRYFFVDRDLFELEREHVILGKWILGCVESEIPRSGDYVTLEVAGESIIVVRDKADQVRAFFNVCRHRGSRICLKESGHLQAFTCPYHAWTYDLTGKLVHHRDMPDWFAPGDHGLYPCRVQTFEGLVFVNLSDADVPDFDVLRNELKPYFVAHGTARSRVATRKTYDIEANWKLVIENVHECLHCVPAHKTFTKIHPHAKLATIPSLGLDRDMMAWSARARAMGNFVGHFNAEDTLPDQPFRAHRRPLREGYKTHTPDGEPAAPLMGTFKSYDGGHTGIVIEPFFLMFAANDHAVLMSILPLKVCKTRIVLTWPVDRDARDDEIDLDRITAIWDLTTKEDVRIVTNNQLGVSSYRFTPGPYHPKEEPARNAIRWYVRQLRATLGQPS